MCIRDSSGKAPKGNGREAQHRRCKLNKKQQRDVILFQKLYFDNWEYFDNQYDADARYHRGFWNMTEQIHHLLAHRGRQGEEECWASFILCRAASEAETPPGPPPDAKVRKLESQDLGPLNWGQSENNAEGAAQTTLDMAEKARHEEERRRATEEFNQRKIDLAKNAHMWCTADMERAAADLAQTRAKQQESTKEELNGVHLGEKERQRLLFRAPHPTQMNDTRRDQRPRLARHRRAPWAHRAKESTRWCSTST